MLKETYGAPSGPSVGTTGACVGLKVYARSRPLLQQEKNQGARSIVYINQLEKQVVVDDTVEKCFKFENVFSESASQVDVYQCLVAPLVSKVLSGQKATVLAYGQTGSGKTYTMGTDPCSVKEDEGILQRAMFDLLNRTGKDKNSPPDGDINIIAISFIEVYNEAIYDLLAPSRVPVKTKAEFGGGMSAVGLIQEKVFSVDQGLKLVEKGSHQRTVASTALNQHSSRSHALIYLTVQKGGSLILVDLAGAEGVGRAHTSGQQFTEGVHINKGLLTLGRVLASLSNPGHKHVAYRESILTRLLKDSLEGCSHTAMIACLNPASINLHETINTLRYAEQAQNIRTKPQALSTIKRAGIKRRFEDVTATPGAWKRRALTSCKKKEKEHNTTVSTPGHRPAAKRALPMLNNTFATPSSRVSEVTSLVCMQNLPLPCPSIRQPIFEDDSPSRLSTISAIEDLDARPSQFSPLADKIASHVEKSMITHFESIEDRVAEKIMSRLKKCKTSKRSRKSTVKRISSTPDGKKSAENDASDDSFSAVACALFSGDACKDALTKLITGVIKDVQSQTMSTDACSITQKTLQIEGGHHNFRKPFDDLSNITKGNCSSMDINASAMKTNGGTKHPITSTTFNDKRHVRRSTRLSIMDSRSSAVFSKISPVCGKGSSSPELFSDIENTTVIQNRVSVVCSEASPLLLSRVSPKNSDLEDTVLFQQALNLPTNNISRIVNNQNKRESCNLTMSSPLQIDRVYNAIKAPVRRSSRLSAIKSTQRTYEILTGSSPATILCKNHKSSAASDRSKGKSLNKTVCAEHDVSVVNNESKTTWKLVMSPGQQETYSNEILTILNTGTVRKLQLLPTIGPKTAMIIYNYRLMYGEFASVEDLGKIPALPKSFYIRFMKANLMNRLNVEFLA